jgi:sugar-specific transcriptional regulator TrmB
LQPLSEHPDYEKTMRFLSDFGFGQREIPVYMALISGKEVTPAEISKITGVERADTYRLLEDLVRKGFAIKVLGKPAKYAPTSPEKAFKRSFEERFNSLVLLESRVGDLRGYFEATQKETPQPMENRFEVIKSSRHTHDRVEEMFSPERCKKEILSCATENSVKKLDLSLEEILKKAVKRGVEIRTIVPVTNDNIVYVKRLSNLAKIRHTPFNPSRLIIVDRKEAMAIHGPMDQKDSAAIWTEVGLWASHKAFCEMLAVMFDGQWELAKSLRSRIKQIQLAKDNAHRFESEQNSNSL